MRLTLVIAIVGVVLVLGGFSLVGNLPSHNSTSTKSSRERLATVPNGQIASLAQSELLIRRLRNALSYDGETFQNISGLTAEQWDELEETLSLMVHDGNPEFAVEIESILSEKRRIVEEQLRKFGSPIFEDDELIDRKRRQEIWLQAASNEDTIDSFLSSYRLGEFSKNLELLTALRRLQGLPDPVHVSINAIDPGRRLQWPDMPVLKVTVQNVDVLQQTVGFTVAGDNRSGRWARFHVQIKNSDTGELLDILPPPSWIGGGIVNNKQLHFREGWHTKIYVQDYVNTLTPGKYLLKVFYHNERTIDRIRPLTDLIFCESDEYRLLVEDRVIWQSAEERKEIETLLSSIDRTRHTKVITGQYGQWAYEHVSPETSFGKILTASWAAVPALLDELQDETQSPMSRAHTLAMLYSITGEVDPRLGMFEGWTSSATRTSALGPYESLVQSWSLSSHLDGESSGSMYTGDFGNVTRVGLPEQKHKDEYPDAEDIYDPNNDELIRLILKDDGSSEKGPLMWDRVLLDPEKQKNLATEWKSLRERIHVKDPTRN